MQAVHPKIPREEYRQRWDRANAVLHQAGVDLILAYSDDRATYGNAYARYFADFQTHFENTLVMFLPDRDPVLLVGPESIGYAGLRSAISDIRVLAEFAADDEDYPFTRVEPLREIVSQCIPHPVRRVGLAAKIHMSATLYEAIRDVFPDAEFVNLDGPLSLLRGVKTPAEIEVIRHAYQIANAGMEAAVAAIRPGVTERQVAAEAEYAMRKAGCEGFGIDTIVASGPNARPILARTTNREIQKDDVVVVTVAPRYEGYHGACGRTVIVGNPDPAAVAAIDAAIEAQNLCGQALCPGKVGRDVEAIGRKRMADAGYGENFLYSGLHSIGVTEFEPPILGPSSSELLRENMVISVDIPLFEARISGVRIEDGYLLTAAGTTRLTTVPQRLQK